MDLDGSRVGLREPSGEHVAQLLLERERRAILDHDVLEPRDGCFSLWRQRLNAQALGEPVEHLAHELRETWAREPVVERLVGDGDAVVVIEFAQQVGERFDLSACKTGDRREEQAVRRDGAEPLALPGPEAELVDLIADTNVLRAHSGKTPQVRIPLLHQIKSSGRRVF